MISVLEDLGIFYSRKNIGLILSTTLYLISYILWEYFDRFAKTFLDIKNLTPNTKEFYMKIQEYLYIHEDGTAQTTYSINQLAELADVD